MKIGFIGAGNMGEAIMRGLISAKLISPSSIMISDKKLARVKYISAKYKVKTCKSNSRCLKNVDIVILCIKPQDMKKLLSEFSAIDLRKKLIITIAAGVRTSTIEKSLKRARVIRVMPNTPALLGKGMSVLCRGKNSLLRDFQTAKKIFSTVGECLAADEEQMDAFTAVSGCGPAYVFLLAELMIKAGISAGLSKKDSEKLVKQTFSGAAQMMEESGMSPEKLRIKVTSPGGMTEEALKIFYKNKFSSIVKKAVIAAKKKGKKLSSMA
ncbi:MAG: pyrroline-5-carboxylate reductase [Candidatus Aureabacteria bacterium]|nr:pyrroline-5-carboxylate reductase [Candidatus Auribacterota bacterium]MCK5656051.1 pyrroline-5-carboxylate reductase [Candidatus Auribacterota bacterium]